MARDFSISDFSGGYNDTDPPTSLAPNQCVKAENIDFFKSPCGARRHGCSAITLPLTISGIDCIVPFLFRHLPTSDETAAQLWAMAITINGFSGTSEASSTQILAYKDTSWHTVTFMDAPSNRVQDLFQTRAQSLHGKMFIAYRSAVDRLHVWDGINLRPSGLLQPLTTPTAANSGSGAFLGPRYYRSRETFQSGGKTLLRSEPSLSVTFTPSGSGSGALVTAPAVTNGSGLATHWELEASLNNADYYVIATTAIATTTFTDTQSAGAGYSSFPLSEDIGDYLTIPSGKYLLADEDRLLIAGSFENDSQASVVRWTPVFNDPGTGNDERIPLKTDNALNLDGFEGGGITGMAGPINGIIYVFKSSHIYKLVRTGQVEAAYSASILSRIRGAIPDSVIEGVDQAGRPTIYFLDPKVGPVRLGDGGLLTCGSDILNTWSSVNLDTIRASVRSVFYPFKKQANWWIATGSSSSPDTRITLQVDSSQMAPDGLRYGWTKHTGLSSSAIATCQFASNIEANVGRSLSLKPFISVGNVVYIMDTGFNDGSSGFTSTLVSKPFILSGSINNKAGVRAGSLIGAADANAVVNISLIKDFGVETSPSVDMSLAPVGTEDPVIKIADSLRLSECRTAQIKLTDGAGNSSQWHVDHISLVPRSEESA